jgi:8-oxo-dGTP pyrophosphatase MutT (NUDIX family)
MAFVIAALRETFEETGILLDAASEVPRSVPMKGREPGSVMREGLHRGKLGFPSVLNRLGATLGVERITYVGHWTTPVQERYRYDTRFFASEVPSTCAAYPDGEEMLESLWLTPSEALDRNRQGMLPLVIPTMVTLESLAHFDSPGAAIRALGGREVPRLIPRVEVSDGGVSVSLE